MSNREKIFQAIKDSREESRRFNSIYNQAIEDAANKALTLYEKEQILGLRKTYTL